MANLRLDANEGENQLHGGSKGFGSRLWSIVDHSDASVTLGLVSEDGDMGYPGRLLRPAPIRSRRPGCGSREATSDKPTPVNLTTHGYFNLDGSPVSAHELTIAGDFITPTRPDLIPTGEITALPAPIMTLVRHDRSTGRTPSTTSTMCCVVPMASFATR